MIDWLKDHKFYVAIAVVLLILLGYYLVQTMYSTDTEQESQWKIEEGDLEEEYEQKKEDSPEQATEEEILVDVKGAVQKPGVYKAILGERVIDVIERAGGTTDIANSSAINFAMRVADEMVLYVPSIHENIEDIATTNISSAGGGGDSDKVNINKATQPELETLSGIGPSKAQAIIEYRETNGPFKSIEDIMSISGFGEKTFEKLKDSITVN